MSKYKDHTLKQYLDALSRKAPVPGGGSAAALSASLGAALISMVAHYSLGKNKGPKAEKKIDNILKNSESLRKRFLELVDLDAKAYLKVVKTRKSSLKVKNQALKEAKGIPLEITKLSYRAVLLTPGLVQYGNKNLISDVEVAIELLLASFNSALALLKHS